MRRRSLAFAAVVPARTTAAGTTRRGRAPVAAALVLAFALVGCNAPGPVTTSTTTTTSTPATTTTTPTVVTLPTPVAKPFDDAAAFAFAREQVEYANGTIRYRVPGTSGNDEAAALIASHLRADGWAVSYDNFTANYRCAQTPLHNVIGVRPGTSGRTAAQQGTDAPRASSVVILGAHYDTRPIAESDPDPANRTKPIPGANDGASGVAVLLELARTLGPMNDTVRLVFFDAEDGGDMPNSCDTQWLIGSERDAGSIPLADWRNVRAMVLVDLVGDPNLSLPRELNSDSKLQDQVYSVAGSLGYAHVFTNDTKNSAHITDDHVPYAQKSMPALDLIHLVPAPQYFPEWHHTQHDDMAHVSATSLGIVGRTLKTWLETLS